MQVLTNAPWTKFEAIQVRNTTMPSTTAIATEQNPTSRLIRMPNMIADSTSLAAESLNLGDKIGAIAPGMEADIIAAEGDPLKDITSLRRILFVMKGGRIYKEVPGDGKSR